VLFAALSSARTLTPARILLIPSENIRAALLGMTPENLSRAFSTLAPYGVAVNGAEIALTNLKDLETLAKPTPLIDDPNT